MNVQVIVGRDRKVLWRSINARGSEHDSSAFTIGDWFETIVVIINALFKMRV